MYARRLITLLCCFAASLAYGQSLEEVDIIVVGRVLGPAEYDKRLVHYEDGSVVPNVEAVKPWAGSRGMPIPPEHQIAPETWIPRVRFETVLALKGNPGPEFTYTNLGLDTPTFGFSPTAEPARTPSGLGRSSEDPTGNLYLLCLGKRGTKGLFAGIDVHEKPMFIRPKSADECMATWYALRLPEARYVLEGKTARQRWASIIIQAWQKEPARPDTLLKFIGWDLVPMIVDSQGNWSATDGRFVNFAEEKLLPRLSSLKSDRLLNKIRINYWCWRLTVNTDKYFPEFQRLVEELDRTWPDPVGMPSDMFYYFDGLYGPQEFIRSMVAARSAFIRAKAVENVMVDPANLGLIVSQLRVETSDDVMLECMQWLRFLKNKGRLRYADAPTEKRNGKRITNLEEIIKYWSDK